MTGKEYLFTSESVSEGHPDKMCDQISDGILDALLEQDPDSRVACETLVKTGMIVVAGEVTTKAQTSYHFVMDVARQIVRDIGFIDSSLGFDADTCSVLTALSQQSEDIDQGVSEGKGLHKEQGAGDQGMMFGFACDETKDYMPFPIYTAHRLVQEMATIRKRGELPFLRPDSKSQVTVEYRDGKPVRADTVLISTQHDPDAAYDTIKEAIVEEVVKRVIPPEFLDQKTTFLVNPTGRFVNGGPYADCGLTGRKIIVDTYGGYGRHGGGAFSGKDPSKVDRSAAYMARYIAKNLVAADLAKRCEVQLAYAIGVAEPVGVYVDTFGTGVLPEERISAIVRQEFDLRPAAIIQTLDLKRPIYRETAAYGHFGRPAENGYFPWERIDRIEALKRASTTV
ncbi:MAG: methionine adenosyltransferase [Desulfurellaceae bacterium]|nr:methionine adenosyltransferase [Desulfurellaceae bacterium]